MRLKAIDQGAGRDAYLPLLLLADDSEQQVLGYMQQGILFVAEEGDEDVGIVLAIPLDETMVELKAVAVEQAFHNQGIGQRMLAVVIPALGDLGYGRIVLGTSNSGIGQIAFYQKAGFRMWKIEQDFFSPERGYPEGLTENGIPMRDMVWFALDLPRSNPG